MHRCTGALGRGGPQGRSQQSRFGNHGSDLQGTKLQITILQLKKLKQEVLGRKQVKPMTSCGSYPVAKKITK